ncbi:MAG: DegT/DnrJ/EryC1/StrS family aminotransferase [Chlorobium sp.]|nr:MAG: DegT/DnrJ/EryC1/StrS family aminotransferase [Chlorobium sp.]
MMIKFVDLYHQYQTIKTEIDGAILTTIEQSAFIGGASVKSFEAAFADYQQAAHCVGVANGTDALEIAIEALGFPSGSEIIVPANSFISSAEAVTRCGHRVVFADINPATYTLNLLDVEKRITNNTKAIIAVHLYGHPCDIDGLKVMAAAHNLKLIEDCAQAHGGEYKGRRVGALGDIGAFSFYPGKNLGAYGDGGAIMTNDYNLATRCRMIANHGRIDKYNHLIEGRNSRLDGLQAAILNVKLKHLDGWIDRRNALAQRYYTGLRGIKGLVLPVIDGDVRHAFHLFVVRLDNRNSLKDYLAERAIETGIHYPIALPKLAAYEYLGSKDINFANNIDATLLSLPMGEHVTDSDADNVINAIISFFREV